MKRLSTFILAALVAMMTMFASGNVVAANGQNNASNLKQSQKFQKVTNNKKQNKKKKKKKKKKGKVKKDVPAPIPGLLALAAAAGGGVMVRRKAKKNKADNG